MYAFELFISIIILIVAVQVFLYFFPLIRIIGDSMYPHLRSGEWYIGRRIFFKRRFCAKLETSEVVCYKRRGFDRIVVKRILHTRKNGKEIWLQGDNAAVSDDSRRYGWVPYSGVKNVLIKRVH